MKTKFCLLFLLILIFPILKTYSQVNSQLFIQGNIKKNFWRISSKLNLYKYYNFVNNKNRLKSGSYLSKEIHTIIAIDPNGNKSKYSYYYDSHNRIKSFYIDYLINNYYWHRDWRVINTYDQSGRLLEVVSTIWQNSKWVNVSRETYFYNDRGKIDYILNELWKQKYWFVFFKENYFYYGNGNIKSLIKEDFSDSVFINSLKVSFTYQANGFVNSILTQIWVSENWQNYSLGKYEADSNGTEISAEIREWNNNNWENYILANMKNNSNGDMIYVLQHIWNNTRWVEYQRTFYNYDEKNNFISGNNEYLIRNKWTPGNGFFSLGDQMSFIATKIFVYYSNITGVVSNNLNFIKEFKLLQNYPNPFNPSTQINYTIPKNSFVELKVYDLMGREITTLVNEFKNAGSYNIAFDASSLSSGIYFYKLQSGSFVDVKKMIFIK